MLLLLLIFVVVPVAELWLLLRIGGAIGALPTIAIILGTGVVGTALARHAGLQAMREFTAQANAGQLPTRPVVDGLLILTGGMMLLAPGVVTDVVGLVLLFPPTRAPIRALLLAWVKKRIAAGQIVWYGPAGPAQDPYRSTRRPPPGPIIDATLEPTEERERERPDDAGQADGEDAPGGPPVPRS